MKNNSLSQKLIICLLAGLVSGATVLRIGNRFLTFVLPLPVVVGLSVLLLVISLVYAVVWHRGEKRKAFHNDAVTAFWIAVIRYAIALDLSMFGFQKIFHLQFITPLAMLDEPFSNLSSQWLTWSYFGHSYGFVCVIAGSQIIGSLLLVFNRTRLLGLIVLMPVLLNIIFIDYFYELNFGVLLHALIVWIGVVYLLLLDYDRLVEFFLKYTPDETSLRIRNTFLKNIGRFSILFVPLLLIAVNGSPNKHPGLRGKYAVAALKVNGKPIMAPTCQDSLLTLVYFDLANECVFEFKSQQKRMFGTYSLDDKHEQLMVSWHFPPAAKEKQFKGTFSQAGDTVALSGTIGNDTIQVSLRKLLTH
jgi:hypothetical protein